LQITRNKGKHSDCKD